MDQKNEKAESNIDKRELSDEEIKKNKRNRIIVSSIIFVITFAAGYLVTSIVPDLRFKSELVRFLIVCLVAAGAPIIYFEGVDK